MTTISCMIIDDQSQAVELIKNYIQKIPLLSLRFATTNVVDALTFLDNERIDCIFLDIEMPQMTGLELVETLKEKWGNEMPKIILITAHDKYAVLGFDFGVFDYLLKPISFKRFKISIDRLALQFIKGQKLVDSFFVDLDGKKLKINFNEIVYVEGAGNYIYIVTDHSKLVCYKTMNSIQATLPEDKFIRIHKSFIVSILHIQSVKSSDIYLTVNNIQKVLPIGLTYKDKLLRTIGIC